MSSPSRSRALYCSRQGGGYFHFLSLPLRGILPVSLLATLPWKASRAASIFPASTQDSSLKRRTCCVTAIYKLRDTLGSAPSLPRILASRPQVARALCRFLATAGQSSSVAFSTLPRYLNSCTEFIFLP